MSGPEGTGPAPRRTGCPLTAPLLLLLLLAVPGTPARAFQPGTPPGAVGDGIADDTLALQEALDLGNTVMLAPGRTYRITRRLDITRDDSGLVGDGTPTLLMDSSPGAFDNEDPSRKYAPDATAILADGVASPRVQGIRIRYDNSNGERVVKAIAFRRCSDFLIADNDIAGFAKADGIVYAGACQRGRIAGNVIHDGYTNSAIRAQITGIVLDDDDQGSTGVEITGNRIFDLTVGPDFERRFRAQTDGINITTRSRDVIISRNAIANVGEGVDTFGTGVQVIDNVIDDTRLVGIKLVHGASASLIARNIIRNAGLGGIMLGGSHAVTQDTAGNIVRDNVITGVNTNGRNDSRGTFGIGILRGGDTGVTGTLVTGNTVVVGERAKYGILIERGSGRDNVVRANTVTGGRIASYRIDPDAGRQE